MHLSTSKKILSSVVTTTTVFWSMGLASLAPLAASAAVSLNAGDLIRGSVTPAVYYYGGDGKRYVFPNEKTFSTWYSDFSSVKKISDADLQAIPLASSNVTYRPGTRLVKVTTDPKVYAVDKNGALRWVKTEAVAVALWGANWAQSVDDLPDAFFANYHMGADINAAADFNVSAVAAASPTIAVDKGLSGGTVVTGALSVALASDTPAAASVANGAADVVFTKVTFTGTGTITNLKVTRTGLSSDTRLSGVKLFDGTTQLGTSQTLNSAHQASFNGLNVAVSGSKTLTLAGDIVAAGGAGEILKLGIAAASDVVLSGGVSPSGTFPLEGNGMTIVSVSIGSATLSNGPQNPSSDLNVDADATDFRFLQVRVTAGSNEDVVVKQIVAVRSGTAADSDVKNAKLVNDTSGTTLGTVASLSNGRAVFDNLNVLVKKGAYVDLSLLASATGAGSSRTIGFELHDGTTYLVRVVGATYGFGITPTRSNFCATAGITGGACQTQTIKLGTLDVSRSAQSPSAGNVPLGGSNVLLGAFDFRVTGEPIRVSSMQMQLTVTPAATTTAATNEVTNIGIYDSTGALLAGPKDGSGTAGAASTAVTETFTYTDTMTLPVGTTVLYVKANLSTSMSANDTLLVTVLAPQTTMTVRGDQSGKALGNNVRTTSPVAATTQTIQGPSLRVFTAANPPAGSVVRGIQGFTFATVNLDTSGSGEDVKVSEIRLTDAGATPTDLIQLELWGDADNTDTTDTIGVIQTSNSTAVGAATNTFTFSTPLRVSKTKGSTLYMKANILSTATAGTTHTLAVSSVTANGWTTGSTVTVTPSGAGQLQTVQGGGSLKVEMSGTPIDQAQLVAGQLGNAFVQYKLTAKTESIDVKTIPVTLAVSASESAVPSGAPSAAQIASVGNLTAYVSDTPDGTMTMLGNSGVSFDPVAGTATVDIQSSPLRLVKDKEKYLTLKLDLKPKEDLKSGTIFVLGITNSLAVTAWGNNANVGTGTAGNYSITANGVDSQSQLAATSINSTGAAGGLVDKSHNMPVYDGILTVTKSATQPVRPSGDTPPDVFYFDLTATGDTITVSDLEFVFNTTCTITASSNAVLQSRTGGNQTYATWNWSAATPTSVFKLSTAQGQHFHVLGTAGAGGQFGATGFSSALTVAPGSSKQLKLAAGVSGCTNPNNLTVRIGGSTAGASGTASGITWKDGELATAVDSTLTKNLSTTVGVSWDY
ncbi:hypothetical protein HZA86_00755 [Candidatus Uhrbacteria bacterium]|nr:hypothetical protein [Candidatus Uhrbacteria bacterium]